MFAPPDARLTETLAPITDFDACRDARIVPCAPALPPHPVLGLKTGTGAKAVTRMLDGLSVAVPEGDRPTLGDITLRAA